MLNIKKLTSSSSDYLTQISSPYKNVQEIPGTKIILLISSKQRTVLLKAGPESRQSAVVSGNREILDEAHDVPHIYQNMFRRVVISKLQPTT
jgi:hypothetical protein